jgi:hypothetical protein
MTVNGLAAAHVQSSHRHARQADGWGAARSMAAAAVRARADTAARQYAVADMALEAAACWVRMTRA